MDQVIRIIPEVSKEVSNDESWIIMSLEAYPTIENLCNDFAFGDQQWMPT